MKKILFLILITLTLSSCTNLGSQERTARRTVKTALKNLHTGDSYKSIAWEKLKYKDICSGTGYQDVLGWRKSEEDTPTDWSIVHTFRMKNKLGMDMLYTIRFFFTDQYCTSIGDSEYVVDK